MKFNEPAGQNPIDNGKVIGRATDRIDGPLKTTGTAPYAYERHDVVANQAYGYILGAGIAKGRITAMDADEARRAPGVIKIVLATEHKPLKPGPMNTARLFGGPEIEHYHQAIGIVVAETFEQARAAAALVRMTYDRTPGKYDLAAEAGGADYVPGDGPDKAPVKRVGDFAKAYADAPVKIDSAFTTANESHSMMEPHATIAAWDGDKLTVWTSNQMITWAKKELAKTLEIPADKVRVDSPYVGGGFGGKLFLRSDVVLAAIGAKAAGRPVKVALTRPMMANNTTHRPATIQRLRLAATRDGKLTAIAHNSTSGNLKGGDPETAIAQTKLFYAAPNRETFMKLAVLDLPEGNAMRAPGEGPGLMALEVAMDEMAEKLGMDPVEFRIVNDTQVDPEKPERKYSDRNYVQCLRTGAEKFGWSRRNAKPGQMRDGKWLVGMGVAGGFRNNMLMKSAARVKLDGGRATVETDMTDIGTGTYTIIGQTAAEMLGLPLDQVTVKLGDSDFPSSAGSGGQWGAANSTAGVYAACVKLREAVATKLGLDPATATFADGRVIAGNRSVALTDAGSLSAEDGIEYGDIGERVVQSTFAGHFVEVGVDAYTGEIRVRRMLACCDAGRILNPKSARSQVIGGMTMAVGSALMEELAVDTRFGFFVNHDLAGYEVPVHADIPHQEVIFLDTQDPYSTPMKAKGVGELGICGVGAAVANAVYNATGVRVREYPITLDKLIDKLPAVA
ncbi:xanthine dehydrogenase [Sphingomonas sp. Leaf33]|uniref:aldehyde oxidoreductase molybdenum-binding subunit PaoC n=1 Tax=Sphingomonas sp. Leaf33 TaxID=1736215 RepID=UPI0006F39D87|nr:aldehyde oxidoreductase molybdenum-binding subunit PaoC [Sphingomonas sp. Leaf33]KQN25040.1 xanthine dehydrogenase [Sphingomonas sp. Leaf33]